MKKPIHILCPEYVPLENKGEEAIIQGTIDSIFGDNTMVEYHLLDSNIHEYQFRGGFHMHPAGIFFSDWRSREFGYDGTLKSVYSSLCSLVRNGLNLLVPFWIKSPHFQAKIAAQEIINNKTPRKKYEESIALLKKVDYIIAGHNGGLDEYVCHICCEFHKLGMRYAVFGSSMKPKVKGRHLLEVYRRCFENSDYNYVRNPLGYSWAIQNFPDQQFYLGPDPAFHMRPNPENETTELLSELELTSFLSTPTILFTTAEPAPIARFSFDGASDKIDAHRKFLSSVLQEIVSNTNLNVLFLPHTIGPSKRMDDRAIAADVIKRANLEYNPRVKLLTNDLNARQLKGIIRSGHFLIAERVHSIIGSVGVSTPFLCLASEHDTRVTGIIKEQLGLKDWVYHLNNPDLHEVSEIIRTRLEQTDQDVSRLNQISVANEDILTHHGKELLSAIDDACAG